MIGAACVGEYAKAQMETVWEVMRLGHRFARKKGDVRAFVLSADLFPPNLVKHGISSSMYAPIEADKDKMKRVLEFIHQKRCKDDIVLLFDGRSRSCRKIFEDMEEKFAASGAHSIVINGPVLC